MSSKHVADSFEIDSNTKIIKDGSGNISFSDSITGTKTLAELSNNGVDTSGTPIANSFARFVDSDTIEGRTPTQVRSDLNIEDGATGDQTAGEIEAIVNHDNLLGFESDEHFTEASIDHANIQNIGSNTHPEIDTFIASKGQVDGLAVLDGSGKVPSTQLPSYVDDVEESVDFASLPATGETGKIYITLDTNKTYRWGGSAYAEIGSGSGSSTWGGITGTLSNQTDLQNALNAKEDNLTKGDLTEATSSILSITGGAGAIIGTGISIQVEKAADSQDGYISSTDWNTFNNKQDVIGYTPENVSNKIATFQATPDDTHYPTEKLVKDSLDGKQGVLTFDSAPTDSSVNPVTSGGVFDALGTKLNTSDFGTNFDSNLTAKTTDDITEGSTNLYDKTVAITGGTNVTVGGTYPNFSITDNSASDTNLTSHTSDTSNPHSVTAGQVGAYTASETDTLLSAKQNTLTFDSVPTNASTNPVTSDGVFDALATKEGSITATTTTDYYRGDKTFQTLNGTAVAETYAPTNYTESGSTVRGHFEGIDTSLGILAAGTNWNRNSGTGSIYPSVLGDKIGMGTNTPTARTHIKGVGSSTSYGLKIEDSSDNKNLYVRDDGQVEFKNYTLPIADGTANQVLKTDGSGNITWTSSIATNSLWDADADTGIQVEESADEDKIRFDTAGGERMVIDNSGKVGIGTSNPSYGLHINSTAGFQSTTRFMGGVSQGAQGIDRIDIGVEAGTPRMVFEDAGSTIWLVDNSSGRFRWYVPGVEHMSLESTSSASSLHLKASGSDRINLNTNGNSYFNGGNLGIGQSSPNARTHIKATTSDNTAYSIKIDNSSNAKNFYVRNDGQVEFKNYTLPIADGTANQVLKTDGSGALTWQDESSGGTPAGADTQIQFNDGGSLGANANFVWDKTNEWLGIGTSTPNEGLTLEGGVVSLKEIETNPISDVGYNKIYSTAGDYTKLLIHSDTTDGSTTFVDSSNSSHSVTANGDTHHETNQAKFGSTSMYFDGVGDYLSIPDSTDWNFGSEAFTIDFWIKRDRSSTREMIFGQGNGAPGGVAIRCEIDPSNNIYVYRNTTTYSSGLNIADGNWHHLSFVDDGTSFIIYLDGVAGNIGSHIDIIDRPEPFVIGEQIVGGSFYFQGYIDEFQISKGVARWTSNFTPPTSPYTTSTTSGNLYYLNSSGNTSKLNIWQDSGDDTHFSDGNVGIGTTSPTATLDIDGTVKIVDGNEGVGKVLTSDADGLATWQTPTGGSSTTLIEDADSDTKIQVEESADEDKIRFDTAGSERVIIDENGKVGIGTSTPNESLTLDGSLSLNELSSDPSSTSDYGKLFSATYSSGGDPNTKLLIHSDTIDDSTAFIDSSDSPKTITFTGDVHHETDQAEFGATSIYFDGSSDRLNLANSTDFEFDGDFTIDQWVYPTGSNGSLGLVNYESTNKLHSLYFDTPTSARVLVNASTVITGITFPSSSWSHFALVRSGTTLSAYVNGTLAGATTQSGTIGGDTTNYIGGSTSSHFGQGYIDEFRISKGIARWTSNFTPPSTPYTTGGNASGLYYLGSDSIRTRLNSWQESANDVYFSAGNVGVGTASPDQALDVIGTIQSSDLLGGAVNLTTDANGNIIRDPSDINLKENIETIENPLEKVLKLRGVSYQWKDKDRFGDQTEIGFIAQELQEILPEVVREGGEYLSVNTRNILGVVVEAMKEVNKKVDVLEEENKELKDRLSAIEQALGITNSVATPAPTEEPVEEVQTTVAEQSTEVLTEEDTVEEVEEETLSPTPIEETTETVPETTEGSTEETLEEETTPTATP